jgi:hypothetical protein
MVTPENMFASVVDMKFGNATRIVKNTLHTKHMSTMGNIRIFTNRVATNNTRRLGIEHSGRYNFDDF